MNPVIWCVLPLTAGILAAGTISVSAIIPITLAALCLLFAVWCIRQNTPRAVWVLAAVCFFAGMARALQGQLLPADDISQFIGQRVAIYGVVDGTPEVFRLDQQTVSVRYRLRVEAVKAGHLPQSAGGKLFASVRQGADRPVYWYGANMAYCANYIVTTTRARLIWLPPGAGKALPPGLFPKVKFAIPGQLSQIGEAS